MLRECQGEEEMFAVAREIAGGLVPGDVLALHGDLGVGKTTLAKGIIASLIEGVGREQVSSPTFVTLNVYGHIAHFDLYRLDDAEQFRAAGFEEYLEEPYIAIIEWPDIVAHLLPPVTKHLILFHQGESRRRIVDETHLV